MSQVDVIGLAEIAAIEYADIVTGTFVPGPMNSVSTWETVASSTSGFR